MADILPLEEAKAYLRVDGDDDDALIRSLINAGIVEIEQYCGLVGREREETFPFDELSGELFIPRRPVSPDGLAISYEDDAGVEQDVTGFRLVTAQGWSCIVPPRNGWPVSNRPARLTATVGHADDAPYPADALLALKMIVEARYEDRTALLAGTAILDRYRPWRV